MQFLKLINQNIPSCLSSLTCHYMSTDNTPRPQSLSLKLTRQDVFLTNPTPDDLRKTVFAY